MQKQDNKPNYKVHRTDQVRLPHSYSQCRPSNISYSFIIRKSGLTSCQMIMLGYESVFPLFQQQFATVHLFIALLSFDSMTADLYNCS